MQLDYRNLGHVKQLALLELDRLNLTRSQVSKNHQSVTSGSTFFRYAAPFSHAHGPIADRKTRHLSMYFTDDKQRLSYANRVPYFP